jgi:hypothetical protein
MLSGAKNVSSGCGMVFPFVLVVLLNRHCEERSDDVSAVAQRAKAEAIHTFCAGAWIASLRSQ